ncbi:family 16 glycosylhydrolase [Flavobacterium sp. RHBU_3]|uniref:glycoside hydrolase family 16 protein n=1 Tax=Flavobacterium sp. RHBU_3 TaxID=3391184 RepID=UPI0039856188
MKKALKIFGSFLLLLLFAVGCQDDEHSFGDLTAPSNLELGYTIVGQSTENPNGDGSGNAVITAHADGAITYKFIYPDGTFDSNGSGEITKRFTESGVHSYEVTVIAYGKGGTSTTGSITITDLLSTFDDPITVQKLTGGATKVWYWAASEAGHLGVGPNTVDGNNYWASWYMAQPFEKAGSETSSCLYNNKLTFTKDGNLIRFSLDNGGATFFNAGYVGVAGGSQTEDTCLAYDTSGQKTVSLEPKNSVVADEFTTGTQMKFSDNGFMGYYIGTNTYEILEITDNRMVVRAVQGNNSGLAWYHIFTTEDPYGTPDPQYNTLMWADEFDYTGAPDSTKWTMEIGNGTNGWGNNELEYYRAENATVSDGTLKITAKKETYNGYSYTSARMNTHNKYDFKYGRVAIKVKLPTGGGTWPALWMLGSNYETTAWPACGEIDIMEHVGNSQNVVHSTLHYPGNSGGNANTSSATVAGVSDGFKIYELVWSADVIKFYVRDTETSDPVLIKQFTNSTTAHPYFNWNYFLIFNVAMGGNMGGTVDAAFTQSAMEVDYVRVYQ